MLAVSHDVLYWVGEAKRRANVFGSAELADALLEISHVFLVPSRRAGALGADLDEAGYEVTWRRKFRRSVVTATTRTVLDVHRLDNSHALFERLLRLAERQGGVYQGWTTHVIKRF